MTKTTGFSTIRKQAAVSKDGKTTYWVVIEESVSGGFIIRVECQHPYGFDARHLIDWRQDEEAARTCANEYWTHLRNTQHGK